MSKRTAAETVARIVWVFIEQSTWPQADLARKVGVSSRAVGVRLDELGRTSAALPRESEVHAGPDAAKKAKKGTVATVAGCLSAPRK